MGDLQATVELSVEIGKFFNIDLFQRGFYHLRTWMKPQMKPLMKYEVSLPRQGYGHELIYNSVVYKDVAISKTFQIIYKNEEINIQDVFLFKIHILVDSGRISEIINSAQYCLFFGLYFVDASHGADPEMMECVSIRQLNVEFNLDSGIHHQTALIFDYFHLSAISVIVHGQLVTLHEPVINVPKPDKSWFKKSSASSSSGHPVTMETVLFGRQHSSVDRYQLSARLLHRALCVYRGVIITLIKAYNALIIAMNQHLEQIPYWERDHAESIDINEKLGNMMTKMNSCDNQHDMAALVNSNIAQMSAEIYYRWKLYLDVVTLNVEVGKNLAELNHTQKTSRFSEGYLTADRPKALACNYLDNTAHGHSMIVSALRSAPYIASLPNMPLHCEECDGTGQTMPVIFEERYLQSVTDIGDISLAMDSMKLRGGRSTQYKGRSSSLKMNFIKADRKHLLSSSSSSSKFGHGRGIAEPFDQKRFADYNQGSGKPPSSSRKVLRMKLSPKRRTSNFDPSKSTEQPGVVLTGYRSLNPLSEDGGVQEQEQEQEGLPAGVEGDLVWPTQAYITSSMPDLLQQSQAHNMNRAISMETIITNQNSNNSSVDHRDTMCPSHSVGCLSDPPSTDPQWNDVGVRSQSLVVEVNHSGTGSERNGVNGGMSDSSTSIDSEERVGRMGDRGSKVRMSAPAVLEVNGLNPMTSSAISLSESKWRFRNLFRHYGNVYSDLTEQIAPTVPYFSGTGATDDSPLHLIVCVHGLEGNSADLRLVKTYLELCLPNHRLDFLMSERNQIDTYSDFNMLTDRLVDEICDYIESHHISPSKISFIGHSLGNIIIRQALTRADMDKYSQFFHTFLSLSGPHLGIIYNNNAIVSTGLWFMQKWKKSESLLQLTLKDHDDPRQTLIYRLSQSPGLAAFKNILLVGSHQDRYVPLHSARMELCKAALKDPSIYGQVYREMVNNLLEPVIENPDTTLVRYDVAHSLSSSANNLIGRAAHIAMLDSEIFLEKFFLVSAVRYFT